MCLIATKEQFKTEQTVNFQALTHSTYVVESRRKPFPLRFFVVSRHLVIDY